MPVSIFGLARDESKKTFTDQMEEQFFADVEGELAAVMKGLEDETLDTFGAKNRLLVLLYKLTNIPRGPGDFDYAQPAVATTDLALGTLLKTVVQVL
jgi:hypothetical protein